MAWLYAAGILFVGVGLHTFLKRWTTLAMMVLFVMLNFTSSGGLFRPELQNGFFGALHAFWNGAGFVEGARALLYFNGDGLGRNVGTLVAWLLLGLAVTALAALRERAGTAPVPAPGQPKHARSDGRGSGSPAPEADRAETEADEEAEETVGV